MGNQQWKPCPGCTTPIPANFDMCARCYSILQEANKQKAQADYIARRTAAEIENERYAREQMNSLGCGQLIAIFGGVMMVGVLIIFVVVLTSGGCGH